MVQSGETGGTLLTTIVSLDPMYAYFDVDDLTFLQIRSLFRAAKAQSAPEALPGVFLGLANESGYPHRGTIDFVDNQVDPNTGTMRMRGIFNNKDRSLTPGLFVRVHVPLGERHLAVLVSDRAITTDQGQKVIYVVNKDNVAEKRQITQGKLHEGLREITSGIKPNDTVIVEGHQRVRSKVKVDPKTVKMSTYKKTTSTEVSQQTGTASPS